MAEEKDKPLDQQIKEAELAKLKAETADVEKRSKQARVMGVPPSCRSGTKTTGDHCKRKGQGNN